MVNWSNIDTVIDALKAQVDDVPDTIWDSIDTHLSIARQMFNAGWPEQEMLFFDGQPQGIQFELARIVFVILQFCADKNINLSKALESVTASE